jgi:hypothetical protein
VVNSAALLNATRDPVVTRADLREHGDWDVPVPA